MRFVFIAGLLLTTAIAGCGKKEDPAAYPTPNPAAAQVSGGAPNFATPPPGTPGIPKGVTIDRFPTGYGKTATPGAGTPTTR
jgi:hypothetical protein